MIFRKDFLVLTEKLFHYSTLLQLSTSFCVAHHPGSMFNVFNVGFKVHSGPWRQKLTTFSSKSVYTNYIVTSWTRSPKSDQKNLHLHLHLQLEHMTEHIMWSKVQEQLNGPSGDYFVNYFSTNLESIIKDYVSYQHHVCCTTILYAFTSY